MDYLSIKKQQNDRIKKLLRNEPAHLKFILGKMKHTKGPHKINIKGPKKSKTRSKIGSKTRSKRGSKKPISFSKTQYKIKTFRSKSKKNTNAKIIKSIFKVFSKGSKKQKRSKTMLHV